jgi:hypothetical protein
MATLTDLKLILLRIRSRLLTNPVAMRGTGTPVDDPAHPRDLEELDRLSRQLELVMRDLKSETSLLQVRAQSLRKMSRKMSPEDRYRATASVHGRQSESQDLLNLANDIKALLEDLLKKGGLIGEGEISQGIGDFVEKMHQAMQSHGEIEHVTHGPALIPGESHLEGSLEGVTIFVFAALRVLVYLRKRRERARNNG